MMRCITNATATLRTQRGPSGEFEVVRSAQERKTRASPSSSTWHLPKRSPVPNHDDESLEDRLLHGGVSEPARHADITHRVPLPAGAVAMCTRKADSDVQIGSILQGHTPKGTRTPRITLRGAQALARQDRFHTSEKVQAAATGWL
jgi:hypothetical protein